ncbi:PTS sugar transporter subunit IIA [Ellagibacter isourolithinifaciens]|uniref:PTS sugar transporter subunit IIA n=1 Tax=Ellagibacter isourolithinifaciens TaxID=2137581 RepID=UPI003A94E6FD
MARTLIALAAHGPFAPALIESAGMVFGTSPDVEAFALMPGMDPFEYREKLVTYLDEHAEDDCLVLVDLFGGTPSNMAASLSGRDNVEVVSGLNLPMLIEVMARKDGMTLAELRDLAIEAGSASAIDVKRRVLEAKKQR